MNNTEVMSQLVTDFGKAAPALPRLKVVSYDWRSNVSAVVQIWAAWSACWTLWSEVWLWVKVLHSVVDNGIATIFPQAIGMYTCFDCTYSILGLIVLVVVQLKDLFVKNQSFGLFVSQLTTGRFGSNVESRPIAQNRYTNRPKIGIGWTKPREYSPTHETPSYRCCAAC